MRAHKSKYTKIVAFVVEGLLVLSIFGCAMYPLVTTIPNIDVQSIDDISYKKTLLCASGLIVMFFVLWLLSYRYRVMNFIKKARKIK